MRVLIADDESLARNRIESFLAKYEEVSHIYKADQSTLIIPMLEENPIDLVFLDISMPHISGMDIAKTMKNSYPDIKIVFTTAYAQYAVEAFAIQAFDYLLKPFSSERFDKVMERQLEVNKTHKRGKRMFIRTLGQFECQSYDADGKLQSLKWRTKKMKELLAYLVSHVNEEIHRETLIHVLWQDFSMEKGCKNLNSNLYYLRKELHKYGVENMLSSNKATVAFKVSFDEVKIDINRLEELVKKTQTSKVIEAVLDIYQGDYLEKEDYIWSTVLNAAYKMKIDSLVDRWLLMDNTTLTREQLIRIINVLPYNEACYYRLLRVFKEEKNKVLYQQYHSQMQRIFQED